MLSVVLDENWSWSDGIQRRMEAGKRPHLRTLAQRERDPDIFIDGRMDQVRGAIRRVGDDYHAAIHCGIVRVAIANVRRCDVACRSHPLSHDSMLRWGQGTCWRVLKHVAHYQVAPHRLHRKHYQTVAVRYRQPARTAFAVPQPHRCPSARFAMRISNATRLAFSNLIGDTGSERPKEKTHDWSRQTEAPIPPTW